MSIPAEFKKDVESLPPALARLLGAELAAGNEIDEVYHSFPAPPIGAVVKLKQRITTREAGPGDGLSYRAVNSSLYSGEYTDADRRYFIIEPPLPPPEPIDMDAIRARHAYSYTPPTRTAESLPPPISPRPGAQGVVARFEASMVMDYEKWHDGIGYDLDLIKTATDDERAEIEALLRRRGVRDWRDVEALAALNTPAARKVLKSASKDGDTDTRLAVLRHAPHVLPPKQRTELILKAIPDAEPYGGLTRLLALIEEHHPAEVMEALLKELLHGKSEHSVHYAALLTYLHGKADSPFDWAQRPFFLRFGTNDQAERTAAFEELCTKIGVDPTPYLAKPKQRQKGR